MDDINLWKFVPRDGPEFEEDIMYCDLQAKAGEEHPQKAYEVGKAVREFSRLLPYSGPRIRAFAAFALAQVCEEHKVEIEKALEWLKESKTE